MTRIVNIGEALIDEITRPNTAPVEVVGGSMLNVAAGLTRLGHDCELATWFARDARGESDLAEIIDPDGEADPGEVVWTWVPYEEDAAQGKDRPVLVLARAGGRFVVAQLTSKDHDRDAAQEARWGRFWHDVGTGSWDRQGRPSEVRLDRLLLVEPAAVRREGATMKREVFDGVVAALRRHHA